MKNRLFTFALAALTVGLLGSCSKINERIDGLDNRVGNIENEKIASVENQIAAINASIADLGTIRKDITDLQVAVGAKGEDISELKAADEALGKRIDELQTYVDTELAKYATTEWADATFATLEQLKTTNTELGALKETVGKLGETFDGKLADLKTELTNAINTAVSNLETRISTLEARVSALEQMIQSVTIVPAYDDGSVESTKDGVLYLDIIVSPAEAVATLTKDCLKVMVNEVKTKAVDVDTVAVTKFKVDAAKGTITARADISSNLPVASGKALTFAVNVKNGISDYTTEFYPVTLSTESNVTVTDEGSTTKVTIKDDEDFPGSVEGKIPVADGFKESKPTIIKVGGIGTVTFDEYATSKIKANAEQAGATSVFFKVEDVTTTKPVENADVVLEVTMKTVDENGTEVFNKDNAGEGAEVTIEIPIPEEKDVAFVNSVTLVNDAGEPIPGGVVPGSEDFDKERGILSFKVNHFSKYAIDYVTNDQFVAVTGVSIEPVSVTLQVDDTLRLVATIAPEDATNKKVTWSSSDTTKVKVDDTGKITAVAFGQATITVTTKDGGKTADCTVKVSETKTMADILKTTTGIPESQNLTPPANAWVKKTDKDCKAFVGIDAEGDTLFVILKEGSGLAPLGICMDDDFEKIDDNTYQRVEPSVGTFTIKMTEGKFTSYEFAAASGSAYEQFIGTYSAPVSKEYVEIAAKYDGSTVSTLRWYRQSLAITDSGKKAWKSDSGSAVKVPGTGEDVVVGDYFQWGTFAGFYGSGAGTDKGLLPYTSFTSTGCGDGSDAFTFKDGKQFNQTNAPYWSGSAYTKYNTTDGKTELDASDDVASIILGGTWRMPTTKEFQALKEVTYWAWDATDKGYYVYTPNPASDAGKVNDGTGTYNKADALLFFPTAGNGYENTYYDVEYIADYWYGSLNSASIGSACHLFFNSSGGFNADSRDSERYRGYSVRPVQDPAATCVAVTNVSLDVTAKEIEKGGNVQLKVTIVPATATQNGVYWTSSAPTVATVDATGKVTAVAAGTATITATTVDGSKTATCTVTVKITTFKAIYDSDAKTLTFYYDNSLHVGEGVLYDNLPTAATQPTSWGYNGVRSNIEKVEITESVKNYKGLTSTACMFQNMTAASYISGAEYLDVSEVTNMMAMFWNFGSNSSTLSSVPDVKDWKTGKVENMQNMFTSYGAGSKGFNAVPDVGKWNTASVTNMTNMFWCYGKGSEILNAVPDVKEWNTASVTNMNNMFESYGESSNNLNKVPDVSKWNTDRVTDMGDMFLKYGYTSTALNTVPNVSGWNTINVTTMTNMFQNYGYSSTALSTVPNVSNWNTSNVTKMTNMFQNYGYSSTALNTVPNVSGWDTGKMEDISDMFQNYGYSSTALSTVPDVSNWKTGKMEYINNMFQNYGNESQSINCTLDLSGWDLSKITGANGDYVFKFNPKTFNVTIPAKTGEKSNEGGKWYYGNGTNYIAPPTGKTFTPAAPTPTTTGTAKRTGDIDVKWIQLWENGPKFAEYNVGATSATDYGGLYCWGKATDTDRQGAYKGGTSALTGTDDTATNLWGSNWRMPTQTELQGLIDNCDVAWTTVGGKNGCKFTGKGAYASNSVFLPAVGQCCSSGVDTPGYEGYYWSSTPDASNSEKAYHLDFFPKTQGGVSQGVYKWYRKYGNSVRAVLAK